MLKMHQRAFSRFFKIFSFVHAAIWCFLGFKTTAWIIFGPGVGVAVCFFIISFIPPILYSEKSLQRSFSNIIKIDENYIELEGEIAYCKRNIEDIKSIIETENFYYFNFYLPHAMNFLCQKDLLVQGKIEDFEEIFKDKIIKKAEIKK